MQSFPIHLSIWQTDVLYSSMQNVWGLKHLHLSWALICTFSATCVKPNEKMAFPA